MPTKSPARARPVGRPAERGRREVRARLGASARELFARQGFEAVSLREVAEAAGVTPAMVHYYFGGKQGLWLAVLEDFLEEALGTMLAARAEIEGPGGLQVYLLRHGELLGRQPWVAPLLYREVVLGGGPSADSISRFPAQLLGMLRGAIARARERGEVSEDLDTDLLVLSLLSAAVFPYLMRPMVERVVGVEFDAAFSERWAAHAGRLFHEGAKP